MREKTNINENLHYHGPKNYLLSPKPRLAHQGLKPFIHNLFRGYFASNWGCESLVFKWGYGSLEEIWGLKWALQEKAPTISSCEFEFKNQ